VVLASAARHADDFARFVDRDRALLADAGIASRAPQFDLHGHGDPADLAGFITFLEPVWALRVRHAPGIRGLRDRTGSPLDSAQTQCRVPAGAYIAEISRPKALGWFDTRSSRL
jgi:hypothetical protein